MPINKHLQQSLQQVVLTARVQGWAGKYNGASYDTTVPGGQGLIYVTVGGRVMKYPSIAKDLVGLSFPTDDNAPVWLEPEPAGGLWVVVSRRYVG